MRCEHDVVALVRKKYASSLVTVVGGMTTCFEFVLHGTLEVSIVPSELGTMPVSRWCGLIYERR